MKIVGLTGGIGSGKSTVLNQFKNLGINTYSADNAAKKLINSDKDLIKILHLEGVQEKYPHQISHPPSQVCVACI